MCNLFAFYKLVFQMVKELSALVKWQMNKIGKYFLAACSCTQIEPIGTTLLRASLESSCEYVSISKTQKMVSCMEFPRYVSYLAIRKPTVISSMFYWQADIYLQSIVTLLNCFKS